MDLQEITDRRAIMVLHLRGGTGRPLLDEMVHHRDEMALLRRRSEGTGLLLGIMVIKEDNPMIGDESLGMMAEIDEILVAILPLVQIGKGVVVE